MEIEYNTSTHEYMLTLNDQRFDQMPGDLIDTLAANVTINQYKIMSTRILLPLPAEELRDFIRKNAKLETGPIVTL